MRFFLLNSPVEDKKGSVIEIQNSSNLRSSLHASVIHLRSNHSTNGFLICNFVRELVSIKVKKNLKKYGVLNNKSGVVLELVLNYLKCGEGNNPLIRTRFYDEMAHDMNDAIKNLIISANDLIVLQSPVVRCNSLKEVEIAMINDINPQTTIELGLTQVKGQCIDVWQHRNNVIQRSLTDKSISQCIDQLNIKTLVNFKVTIGKQDKAILCYYIKPFQFWEEDGQINQAFCLFREIYLNGKFSTFFKIVMHGNISRQFHQAKEENRVVPGDIIVFINPIVLKCANYKPNILSSGEAYSLQIGLNNEGKVVFCKEYNKQRTNTENPPVEKPLTCSVATAPDHNNCAGSSSPVHHNNCAGSSSPVHHNNCAGSSSSVPLPHVKDSSEPNDSSNLILFQLLKPSKDALNIESLNLISGVCSEFCKKMFLYSELQWNARKEPLCPTCFVVVVLRPCLEFQALSTGSRKIGNIVLVGKKAENFLQVSCNDILESKEKRGLALKVLETKYTNGTKYNTGTGFTLKESQVSARLM